MPTTSNSSVVQTDKVVQDKDNWRYTPGITRTTYSGAISTTPNQLEKFSVIIPEKLSNGMIIVLYCVPDACYYSGPPHKEIDPQTGKIVDVPGQTEIATMPIVPNTATDTAITLPTTYPYFYARSKYLDGTTSPPSPIIPLSNKPPPVVPP